MVAIHHNGIGAGAKALDAEALEASVVATPEGTRAQFADLSGLLFTAGIADAIFPWGTAPKARDRQLRDFYPLESYLLGALGIVTGRNVGFSWTLEGGTRTAAATQDMLLNANYGKGWDSYIKQLSMDLYTQDCGGFSELIRAGGPEASENQPVIGIGHLDSARCFQTGNPQEPIYYRDIKNQWHAMKWYQVQPHYEIESGEERAIGGIFYSLQYSAVTRALKNAQVIRNVTQYEDEKTGGNFLRGMHLVSGFSQKQIDGAIKSQSIQVDNQGLMRYQQPPVISSPDPNAKVAHALLEMATLPDHFDKESVMKWHIAALAMAFLTDYQEFAPLPGGGLGTSAQSAILHAKSRGKSPMLFQKMITHLMNFQGALPANVSFRYTEQDIAAEAEREALKAERAATHQIYITSGVLDKIAVRQNLLDEGDISQETFDELAKRDAEMEETRAAAQQDATLQGDLKPGAGNITRGENVLNDSTAAQSKALAVLLTAGIKSAPGNEIRAFLQTRIHRAFTDSADDLAALGYLDTEGRIMLSGLIGDTLRHFSDLMDEEAWEIVARNIDGDDVRLLIGKMEKSYGSKEIPKGRRELEGETTDEMKELLDEIQKELARELRKRRKTAGEKAIETREPRPASVTIEERVVRDDDGLITGKVAHERVDSWE